MLEYSFITLGTILFLLFLVSSHDLIITFFCIIGFSLTLYILFLFPVDDIAHKEALEATLKYFYLSAISAGLMAFSLLLFIFLFQTTNYDILQFHGFVMRSSLYDYPVRTLLVYALYSAIFAFLFKLAAAPAHL